MRKLKYLLPLLVLLFLPAQNKAAGTFIQSCNIITGAVGTCTLNGVQSGHVIVWLLWSCGGHGSVTSLFADTFTTAWTSVNSSQIPGNCAFRNTSIELFFGPLTQSGNDTFTGSVNGNIAGMGIIVAEYSGITIPPVEDPLHGAAENCPSSCGATASSGNITTTQVGDVLISGGALSGAGGVMTPTNGFMQRAFLLFPAGAFPEVHVYLADKTSGAAGTYAGTWNIAPSDTNWTVLGSLQCVVVPCVDAVAVSNFKLNVPDGVTIDGISVGIGGHQTNEDVGTTISVRLALPDGSVCPTTITAQLPLTDGSIITFGSGTELWGCSFSPALVNNALFSVYLTMQPNPTLFYLYSVKPKVFYH